MKKSITYLFLLFTVTFFSTTQAQEIEWLKLEEAQELNTKKKTAKWIIVDMYTPWCGPCKMMERSTFKDPTVIELMDNFHAVKFNAEGKDDVIFNGETYSNPNYNPSMGNGRNAMHQLTQHFKISGYPTLIILNEKGEIMQRIVGFQNPERMLGALQQILKMQSGQ